MLKEDTILSKIVSAAMIGLLAWNLTTTQRLSLEVAVISSRLQTLEAFIPDSYTVREAASDGRLIEQRLKRLEQLSESNADRIRLLEQGGLNGAKN